jgi:hypothetical protein
MLSSAERGNKPELVKDLRRFSRGDLSNEELAQ